jgi:heme exporter protein D
MNFDMGQYGAYIWPAYGVSALAVGGMTVWAVTAWRRARRAVRRLEKKT